MSILFADIYDGIRAIRISKGVCERDILNYVQEKAGGCMKVGNVLKTIRTLKKLVDDGKLIKSGNRYCFPPRGKKCKEEEEEEEEEDEMPDEDNGGMDMDPDECEEAEDEDEEEEEEEEEEEDEDEDEEDEDEEDEEDEDEEDEDEEDDEEEEEEESSCNENDDPGVKVKDTDTQPAEVKGKSPEKTPAPPNTQPDCAGAQKDPDVSYSGNGISRSIDSGTKNNGRNTAKDKNMLDQNNTADRGETIAFCARDFIDSLAESKSDKGSEEKIEITESSDRETKSPKRLSTSCKKSQPPRKKIHVERFRSRSPLHGKKRDFSHLSHDLGFTGAEKEILGESLNIKMEIDEEREVDAFGVIEKSPARDSPNPEAQTDLQDEKDIRKTLTEPGALNRKGSSDGLTENTPKETAKMTQLKSPSYSNMVWYPLEDNDNHDILQDSPSFENSNFGARKDSMCSVCEKKKRTL